ncbi:MAG: pyruvate, water dikinase regulatory protein [Myxococcota bacterium]|nr:pyruvate, water dikinase regulatory protein [Myxococcota bacterium]
MAVRKRSPRGRAPERPEIFLVSDGTGETVAAAVRAATVQFRIQWRLRTFGDVRLEMQLRRILEQAREVGALVVYTLVNEPLTSMMRELAWEYGVQTVDLLGPLLATLASHYELTPDRRPGALHGFTDDYFRRIEAVEFAVRHDDGANLHTLFDADLVITGVSRTSKTPLSMYLAQRGYKTGNVPLVPGIEPPRELLEIDPRKVFGLLVDVPTLLEVRRSRVRALRAPPYTQYEDPDSVAAELRRARRLFLARGWRTVDITGRAVEENAARILELHEKGGTA